MLAPSISTPLLLTNAALFISRYSKALFCVDCAATFWHKRHIQHELTSIKMQDNILVDYSCTHFAVLPADVSLENYDWLFNDLHSAAEKDLISLRITSHLALPQACPNPACQHFRLKPWTELIRTAESEINAALSETRKAYMRYGHAYHLELNPRSRVRCLRDPDCALAHKQFTLETRSLHSDPFFMAWRALYSGYNKIKVVIQNPYNLLSFSNAERIAKIINDCRFEISKIEYLLNQLYAGINIFRSELTSLQNNMAKRKNIVIADGLPVVSPADKAKLKCCLARTLDNLNTNDGIISVSMPLDESTGKTTGLAFIEFWTSKQATIFADVAMAVGGTRLYEKHRVTFAELTDVSRFDKLEIDEFRDTDMISSSSQGAIDEMRMHMRQKSMEELSYEDEHADYAKLGGSALQECLAKNKRARLLRYRMNHWGKKLIDEADVHVFGNAMYKNWLKPSTLISLAHRQVFRHTNILRTGRLHS
ncbi:uncharacterized protein MYCFIDRAFT_175771 [Pseudocercospora fijiensis CIRAD86]|uniref:RRM domain-containing protein n=1 Tax=Pseudocercospora fijiensis (strain CIRAD86) TaxID=383855 RepID=M3ACH2_PSEFD|nr:uncharacterized protein MYCFIDRAFT_175771 [Pseudocercospora fijiensis CIRAD86]EME82241.1 hypothetical protein MYCFIDRAFT_175771 [Pseudocercospora fijiensis CIRAD86]